MARWGGRRPEGKGWNLGSPRERPKFLKAANRDLEFMVDLRRSLPVVPPESNKCKFIFVLKSPSVVKLIINISSKLLIFVKPAF
jgi:hypothetical protein